MGLLQAIFEDHGILVTDHGILVGTLIHGTQLGTIAAGFVATFADSSHTVLASAGVNARCNAGGADGVDHFHLQTSGVSAFRHQRLSLLCVSAELTGTGATVSNQPQIDGYRSLRVDLQ